MVRISAAYSVGPMGVTTYPSLNATDFTSGVCSKRIRSVLRRLMASLGVAAGAHTAIAPVRSKSGKPDSIMVRHSTLTFRPEPYARRRAHEPHAPYRWRRLHQGGFPRLRSGPTSGRAAAVWCAPLRQPIPLADTAPRAAPLSMEMAVLPQ